MSTGLLLTAVWLFATGAAIGSFLNVVIYRLPAGISLIWPGSHCPQCGKAIRWYDNVPMIGWMVLNGRCRDCRAPISARYPAVEALCAMLFLVLGLVEWVGGGLNLPLRPMVEPDGMLVFGRTFWQLGGIYAFHLLLICTLLPATWIEYDGQAAPVRLFLPALVIGLAASVRWPELHPVPALPHLTGPWIGLIDGTAGLVVGALLGLLTWRIVNQPRQIATILAPACVGLFLGWQAAAVLTVAAAAIQLMVMASRRLVPGTPRFPPVVWLGLLMLLWLLVWVRVA